MLILFGIIITMNLAAQKDDPFIELPPFDSLNCVHYDFEACHWLPYFLDAEIENADEITWTTSGDGTFNDEGTEQPDYYLGPDDRLNQAVTLTVSATGNNTIVSADITLHIPLQLIPVTKDGWTGISTYADMSNTPIPDVMEPIIEHLEIMIDQTGTSYWPGGGVNNLGNWSNIGYQAKFINPPACLPVYGAPIGDQTFLLEGSFTYLPVFTDQLVSIEDLFGDNINNIVELRDWKDSLTWTPDNPTFEYLKPGLAYLVILEMGGGQFTVEFPPYSWESTVSLNENTEPELMVYPNPSHGNINVKLPDNNTLFYSSLYNGQGELIHKQQGTGDFNMNLSKHPKGIYYLKITQGGLQVVRKLVLQ